jgi:hypothetical protein
VDHVVEVGGPGTIGQSIAALCPGGHIALMGILTGLQRAIPTALLMVKQIRMTGITVGPRVQQQQMIRAIEAIRIKPVIDIHFTLEARNYAVQLGPHNIRVNCIAPGLIRTSFSRALWGNPRILSAAVEGTPLRRIGGGLTIASGVMG